ncbi:MAG TPA: nucleotidyltransferase domain-containing protein [Jatrophihabitantaceae bacterium]
MTNFERVDLAGIAERLTAVPGIVGVTLGGSRARGDHVPDSDVDLGLYYRAPLDVAALGVAAREVAGPDASVTASGAWGQWVDGGAWLTVDGVAVDWIYRDLDRVHRCWLDAQAGRYRWHFQVGHPLGFPDFAYAGEVALAAVLADPGGEVTRLRESAGAYPPALGDALVRGLAEAQFLLMVAAKAAGRADSAYVAGCLFRIVGVCAHALHGRSARWLINEKGAVASAGRLSIAPAEFAERAQRLLAATGRTTAELSTTLDAARQLVTDTVLGCR